MSVMDEFKEERDRIKDQPLKKRLEYFWDYYKWYVIGGVLAVAVLCSFLRNYIGRKDYALFGIVVNGGPVGEEELLFDDFFAYAGIDPDKNEMIMNSGYRTSELTDEGNITSQFILTHLSGRRLDLALMDAEAYDQYASEGLFADVRELLSEELFARLEEEGRIHYATISKPETMEGMIPVGIQVKGVQRLDDVYFFVADEVCLGVFANTKQRENCEQFIEYLFSE